MLRIAASGPLMSERDARGPMRPVARSSEGPPLTAEEIQARVLHRDGLILVIDKPAGLAVHAGPSRAPNLEECFDALRFGLPRPPALAHRLDADTSGVLVLGRHPKALSKLGRLFSGRDTEKTYWAVVEGAPPAEEGVFDRQLLKVNTRSGWSVKVSDKGQTAVTRYKVLGRGARHDLAGAEARDRPHPPDPRALRRGRLPGDRRPALRQGRARPAALHLQSRGIVLPLSKTKPPIPGRAPPPPHMLEALTACGYLVPRLDPDPQRIADLEAGVARGLELVARF